MRTTVNIDDGLLLERKKRALSQKMSLSKVLNQVVRQGLASKPPKRTRYWERVFSLGNPLINLDKSLTLAVAIEDEQRCEN